MADGHDWRMRDPVDLYLVRHAQARAADGSYDHATPLSPLGRRQAKALASALADASLTAVYASTGRRARETAEPVARLAGVPLWLDERLFEFEIAGWDPESEEPHDVHVWRPEHRGVPGGETLQDFAERVAAALEEIVAAHAGDAIAVVSHSGTVDAVLRWAMGLRSDSEWRHEFDLPNASITEVRVWLQGRHPLDAPRYVTVARVGAIDHLSADLRSNH